MPKKRLLQRPSVPSHLPADILLELPRGPASIVSMGRTMCCCTWAKAPTLRSGWRLTFPVTTRTTRGVRMSQSLRRIEWTETAGELGALLLELRQIKTLNPLYNRRSRAAKQLVTY